jgi:N-ethylmaleimide reductase
MNLVYETPKAVTMKDIEQLIKDYSQAAANAIDAGFDGVEIHGANGYLVDQFLHHSSNIRQDKFGGSPENMTRFPLAVVDAISERIGEHHPALIIIWKRTLVTASFSTTCLLSLNNAT